MTIIRIQKTADACLWACALCEPDPAVPEWKTESDKTAALESAIAHLEGHPEKAAK